MNDVRPRTANTPEVVRRIDPDLPIRRTETVTSTDGTKIGVHTLGAGEGVLIVGGALSTARDYLPLATVLAQSFTVHLMERRGRGISDPQGPDYKIASESEDLLAVQATTGATRVFGHSYGGLVALETARRSEAFSLVAAYEPFVSIDGSIPLGWIPRYKSYLSNEDTRGAFVCLVQGSGFAPRPIMKMPSWCRAPYCEWRFAGTSGQKFSPCCIRTWPRMNKSWRSTAPRRLATPRSNHTSCSSEATRAQRSSPRVCSPTCIERSRTRRSNC